MDFSFTTEQQLLRDSLQSFLRAQYRFDMRSAVLCSDSGWRPELWRELGELGVLGAALPERIGGSGGGAVETMIVMEELGRALVVEPYLESVVLTAGLLACIRSERADALATAIASGESVATLAWSEPATRFGFDRASTTTATRSGDGWRLQGHKAMVIAASWASTLLVTARIGGEGIALFAVDCRTPGITAHHYPTVDGRRAADLHFDQVLLPRCALMAEPGIAQPLLQRFGDVAIAAQSAEAVGVMHRLFDDTVDYARQRKQFGQTIGSFQVVQHRLVDMYLQIEMAVSASYRVTLSLDADDRERGLAASTAKVTVAEACRFIGQNAVQLHGGIGMTEELPVGSYFKRATMIEHEFGSVDQHLARHARLERSAAA
ncbi:MAG: acyl-CoA dehydrogenase [Hydrocarboniphaga sp.]|uniref:acyl-CoA dehydrogenase family protein n=1 Tax=Hydrocarboniphaga sp. TaxID=2033016 RepID=UPI002603CDA8|nr:acyl-CoA dehydrogenase [Hydrocarboniphaga sp.]MDB5970173.1 acyl-CoA dehydrogenase [Hydrocarboniphaga sp.]